MMAIASALSVTPGMEVSERQWMHVRAALHPSSSTFVNPNGIQDDSVRSFSRHLGSRNVNVAPSGPGVVHLSEVKIPSNSGCSQAPDPWPAQLVSELYDNTIHLGDELREVTPVEDSRQKASDPRRMPPQAFHGFPSLPPSNCFLQAQAHEIYPAHVFRIPPPDPLPAWEICSASHILDGSSRGTISQAPTMDGAPGVEQFFESESTARIPSAFFIEDGLDNAFEMPDCFTSFDALDLEILGSWPQVGKGVSPGHTDVMGTGIGSPIATMVSCESGCAMPATAGTPAASNSAMASNSQHSHTNEAENVSTRCLPKPTVPPEGRPPAASSPDLRTRVSKTCGELQHTHAQLQVLKVSDSTTCFPFTSDDRPVPGISLLQPPPSRQSDSKLRGLMPQPRPDPKLQKIAGPQKSGGLLQLLELGADTRWAHMHVDKLKQAEDHVARERRRRDLMNTRFQTLDTLIPQTETCRKRERLGIVEEAMSYVKQMQEKVLDLGRKKQRLNAQELELKLRRATPVTAAPETSPSQAPPTSSRSTNLIQGSDTSGDLKVEILADDADDKQDLMVFIRCKSTCTGTLLGRLLRCLQRLKLEVSRCSITTHDSAPMFCCNFVCKFDSFQILVQLSAKDIPSSSSPGLPTLAPTIIDHMVASLRPFLEPTPLKSTWLVD